MVNRAIGSFLLGAFFVTYLSPILRHVSIYILVGFVFYVIKAVISRNHDCKIVPVVWVIGFFILGAIHHHLPNRILRKSVNSESIVVRGNGNGMWGKDLLVWSESQFHVVKGFARLGQHGQINCRSYQDDHYCRFEARARFETNRTYGFKTLIGMTDQAISKRMQRIPKPWRFWIETTVFGKWDGFPKIYQSSFKYMGLIHLLVFSGFHVRLISKILRIFITGPGLILYCLRLISPHVWVSWRISGQIVSVFLLFFFLCLIGFRHPSSRAFLTYAAYFISWELLGGKNKFFIVKNVAFLQLVFFGVNWIGISNLLSWTAYLWIVFFTDRKNRSLIGVILNAIYCQCGLSLLTSLLIGVFPVFGFFANLLLAPLFPILFFMGLLRFSLPDRWFDGRWQIDRMLEVSLTFVKAASERSEVINFSSWMSHGMSLLLIVLALCYFFRAASWKKVNRMEKND